MTQYTNQQLNLLYPIGTRVGTNDLFRWDTFGQVVGYSTNEFGQNILVVKWDNALQRVGVHPCHLHIVKVAESLRMDAEVNSLVG